MRIFIGESDRCMAGPYQGKRLSDALLHTFRDRGFAGATLLRGIKGFGASGRLRTVDIEVLSLDLPVIVELVETEHAIQSVLPLLDEMIDGGLITLERARVILYRPDTLPETERRRHRIDGLSNLEEDDYTAPPTEPP
jgi:PII-like signaling protein